MNTQSTDSDKSEARINADLLDAAKALENWLAAPQDCVMNRRQVEYHRALLRAAIIRAEAERTP